MPSSLSRMIALGCCCRRSWARIIFPAMTSRLTFMPPVVEPAQAHTIEPNISRMTANGGQRFAVANPVVVMSEKNWKAA